MEKIEEGHFPPKKPESELASVQMETDNPAKKLARQLDFTGGVPGQALTVSLQEHANQIIQPEVIKSSQLTVSMKSTQVISPQPQLQQHILLMPMQQAPVLPPQPLIRPLSMQSSSKAKDGTPKKPKQCNCKHSRCLKLYCECFASGIFCDGCNCANCHNNVENEASREEAVEATLERNPNAFRPKIASSPHGTREEREEAGDGLVLPKHNKGCHCKKSGCLKKYCECFQANILCSENCRCMDCKNFEGNEERQAHFHGDHANNMAYLQQTANVAITDAIGSSGYGSPPVNKNRKPQELFSWSMIKDPVHRLGQFQQDNQIKASVPPSLLSSIPSTRVSNAAALGPPKPTYRSLLADIIQNHDIKELCSVLIVYAQEAAKILSDEKDASLKQAKHHRKASYPSSGVGKVVPDDCSTGIQAENIRGDESRLDGADVSAERPISPGTLALMCDEQDTTFTAAAAPPNDLTSLSNNTSSQLPHGQGRAEIYPELERIVLAQTRDGNYSLQWESGITGGSSFHQGDILIRSKRVRARPGQMTQMVPLDYSLRSYLEVIFLDPRIKIYVQKSQVKSRPLARSLNRTVVENGTIMGKPVQLTLGCNQLEWEEANCGIFLYWHGRLIEAYKRVGSMMHNGDRGRGVIGVIDVTNLMAEDNGHVWVHNNKQGFQDCEVYAELEKWLGEKSDKYLDEHVDKVELKPGSGVYKPDNEWVQCDKCRKWRMLSHGFNSKTLPLQWFCYMKPFNGECERSEQEVEPGVITISSKRLGYSSTEDPEEIKRKLSRQAVGTSKNVGENDSSHSMDEDQAKKSPAQKRKRLRRSCRKS